MTINREMLKTLKKQKCLDNIQLLDNKKKIAADWFSNLRDEICASFEKIENNRSSKKKNINFNKKKWERNGGGGGSDTGLGVGAGSNVDGTVGNLDGVLDG